MILAAAGALAADPVLYDTDATEAIARVSADSGRPQWQLRPVRLDLVGEAPRVLGPDQLPAVCPSATTNAQAREAVARAEKHVAYQEWEPALAALDGGARVLPCLGEPLEASLAARLYFLSGVVRHARGEAADEAFALALNSQPGLAWDERLPPTAQPSFVGARAAAASAPVLPVAVGPGLEAVASFWVDGRPMAPSGGALSLAPGPHVVQIVEPLVHTLRVEVSAGRPVAIAVPARIAAMPVSALLASPSLDAILAERFPDATVWVWTGSRTWRAVPDRAELPVPPALLVEERRKFGRAVATAGIAAFVVGGAGAAAGWIAATSQVSAVPGETPAEGAARQVRADAVVPWAWAGTGVAVVGAAAAAVGLVLAAGPVTASAAPVPGGAVVAVNLRR